MVVENPYEPIMVELKEVVEETPTIKTFVVELDPVIAFRAGQFVQLSVPGLGESPFTPSSSPSRPERMELTVIRTGKVTDVLHERQAGDMLGIRGPFGKGYPLEKTVGKEVLIVGGGCGLAPLRALVYALFERMDRSEEPPRRMCIKYGARNPQELLYRRE
jgi:NAD(P)H-flavin reductase